MGVAIRSVEEIASIRRAGAVLWRVLERAAALLAPGVTTAELDREIEAAIRAAGAEPILRGYRRGESPPFPGASSICVNEEAVHAIPGTREIRAGDLVSIDTALRLDGWCADAAIARCVGAAPPARERLAAAAREAVEAAVAAVAPGRRWSEISEEILRVAGAAGCRVVWEYAGHGVGRRLHEGPLTPISPGPREDFEVRRGMVFTIEPVLTVGSGEVRPGSDGWSVRTADGADAAHEERTVAVVAGGVEVMTAP